MAGLLWHPCIVAVKQLDVHTFQLPHPTPWACRGFCSDRCRRPAHSIAAMADDLSFDFEPGLERTQLLTHKETVGAPRVALGAMQRGARMCHAGSHLVSAAPAPNTMHVHACGCDECRTCGCWMCLLKTLGSSPETTRRTSDRHVGVWERGDCGSL